MTDWGQETSGGQWFFTYGGKRIEGLRATHHNPALEIGNFGQFPS